MNIIAHFIEGAMTTGAAIRYADVFNPAAGEITGRVSLANAADVDAAVAAANNSFVSWSQMPASLRARILFRFKKLLEQNHDKLAAAITREHGIVLCNARGEVTRGIEVAGFASRIPHLLCGKHSDNMGAGIDTWNPRQPLGVVAGITPLNIPVEAPMWMFPLALACGNTFVLKPSEQDPSPSLMLASLLKQAGGVQCRAREQGRC